MGVHDGPEYALSNCVVQKLNVFMFFNTYKNLVDWSMKALDLGCGERSLLFKNLA